MISWLTLDIGFIDSLACLLRLLRNFPLLLTFVVNAPLELSLGLGVLEWQSFGLGHADVEALHLTRKRFSTFELNFVPTIPALDLMKLVALPEARSKLECLRVHHLGNTGPVARLLQAVMDTLRLGGAEEVRLLLEL